MHHFLVKVIEAKISKLFLIYILFLETLEVSKVNILKNGILNFNLSASYDSLIFSTSA
jgi:hypothetical protein